MQDIENSTFIKIEDNYDVNTITIEDIKNISKYPKSIGKYKDKDILLKKGKYGFYISYDDKNIKILEDYNENLTLEEAILCINSKSDVNNNDVKKINKYVIKTGKYGPYILYNSKFYSIPKQYDLDKLTEDECKFIISIPKKKYKSNT